MHTFTKWKKWKMACLKRAVEWKIGKKKMGEMGGNEKSAKSKLENFCVKVTDRARQRKAEMVRHFRPNGNESKR